MGRTPKWLASLLAQAKAERQEPAPRPSYVPRTAHAREYQRMWAGGYPYPPEFHAFTCSARTRAGTPCKMKTLFNNGRCKLHGGLSSGPISDAGRRQSAENGRKGGRPRRRTRP
jgi:hypothetical protein